MPYNKRWYLVHLLGGGCAECGNQNFYDLEIDHKFNDGDGERKYYTYLDSHYVQNPIRAKQRLQVLCQSCHKAKHAALEEFAPMLTQHQDNLNKMQIFMDILKTLEGPLKLPVRETTFAYALVTNDTFTNDEVRQYIRRMLREASIYESKPGHYNRV